MATPLQRVVTATDFSPEANNAVMRAAMVARDLGLKELRIYHVLEPAVGAVLRETLSITFSNKDAFHDHVSQSLGAIAAKVREEVGIEAETQFLEGRISKALSEALKEGDLLVIGATGRHRLRRVMLGVTALRILHKCEVPVLVTRKPAIGSYQQVLVGTDFSSHAKRAAALASFIAPQADIQVIHACQAAHESDLVFAGVRESVIREYRDKAKQEAHLAMAEFMADLPSLKSEIQAGYPAETLLDTAEERDTELVIVGKEGEVMTRDPLLGNVTQRLVNEAFCDVLIVN